MVGDGIFRSRMVILITFVFAIFLSIFPIPTWALWFQPAWVLLFAIYWIVALPHRVGIATAWFLGFMVDILNGTTLGEHALAFTLIAYLAAKSFRQFRMSSGWQQMMSVALFVGLYQLIVFFLEGVTGSVPKTLLYWLPILTSMLVWPLVFVTLRHIRRRYKVI